MKPRNVWAVLTLVLALTGISIAADAGKDPDAAIVPFIDGQTVLVVRGDMTKVDLKAARAAVDGAMKAAQLDDGDRAEAVKLLDDIQAEAQRWMDEFKQAGGKQIYVELNMACMDQGPAIIVPLGAGADAEAMENLFATGYAKKALDENTFGKKFSITNGCMIFADDEKQMLQMQTRQAVARPELGAMLAEGSEAPVRLAFIPSDDTRVFFQQQLPQLPPEVGGVSMNDLVGALSWGSVAIGVSPKAGIEMVMHYKDAASATTAMKGATTFRDAVKKLMDQQMGHGGVGIAMIWASLIPAIEPSTDGEKLKMNIEGERFDGLANTIMSSVVRGQATAKLVKSASNLRQIGQAILLYTNDSKGAYPADFATLIKTEDITAEVFLNPTTGNALPENYEQMTDEQKAKWVNEESDYIYLGAGLKQGADPAIVVAFEREGAKNRKGINMLFGDGHVENQSVDRAKAVLAHSKEIREKGK